MAKPTKKIKATRWPRITPEDIRSVNEVLKRGIICGPYAPAVKALEKQFAKYVGATHCLTTNSGTAALHVAVAAAGIQPGDVITRVAGESIRDLHHFHAALERRRVGDAVEVTLWRDGKTVSARPVLKADQP